MRAPEKEPFGYLVEGESDKRLRHEVSSRVPSTGLSHPSWMKFSMFARLRNFKCRQASRPVKLPI